MGIDILTIFNMGADLSKEAFLEMATLGELEAKYYELGKKVESVKALGLSEEITNTALGELNTEKVNVLGAIVQEVVDMCAKEGITIKVL